MVSFFSIIAYNYIQQADVHSILETTSQSLLADPDRRFIFVEMAFMDQWWNDKTDYKKKQVKELINSGNTLLNSSFFISYLLQNYVIDTHWKM